MEETEELDERRRRRRRSELATALRAAVMRRVGLLADAEGHGEEVQAVESGDLDPWTAAERIVGG